MSKTVMSMMAHLISVTPEPDREVDASRVILLLDFRKAYDTISRIFLFKVLRFFGFAEPFITLIRRLHDGTILSEWRLIRPHTCRNGDSTGLSTSSATVSSCGRDSEHRNCAKFANQWSMPSRISGPRAQILSSCKRFDGISAKGRATTTGHEHSASIGELSGLFVQPAKSVLIFLNTAVELKEYEKIHVLLHGDTTRYLGY